MIKSLQNRKNVFAAKSAKGTKTKSAEKGALSDLNAKFLKQSKRDQFLILLALLVVIILPAYTYGVEPAVKKIKDLKETYYNLQEQFSTTENVLNELTIKVQQDPAVAMRQEIEKLRSKTQDLTKSLSEVTADFIPAFDMPVTLQEVLADVGALEVVSVSSIEPTVIAEDPKTKASLYRHGTRIVLMGNYLDAMRYLQILENLDKKFIWGEFSYELKTYPKGRIEINVYTLSNSKDFISG